MKKIPIIACISMNVLMASEHIPPACCYAGKAQGLAIDVKKCADSLEQKINQVAQSVHTIHVFHNHVFCAMEMAIHNTPCEGQNSTVDRLYDQIAAIPGHSNRHHRTFRDRLVMRFNGLDQCLAETNAGIARLEARLNAVDHNRGAQIDHLNGQMGPLLARLQTMEQQMAVVQQENRQLRAELDEEKRLARAEREKRSASPRGRR